MGFSLALPEEKEVFAEIEKKAAVSDERAVALQTAADAQASKIMDIDLGSLAQRNEIVKSIESFGADSMNASDRKNAFLATRIKTFQKNGDETGEVAKNLVELSVQMKNLDPTGINFSEATKSKFLNPVRKYFAKYEKADDVISGIVKVLDHGKDQLDKDNQTLLIEQVALENETKKLNEYIKMGTELDNAIQAAVDKARSEGADENKIKFVETEVLFPLRQKIEDMGTMIVVNYQGIGTLDLIRSHNRELIRGVNRSQQVSISALRIGVMAAQALSNQKVVLNAVNALNQGTENMITATAKMLNQQSKEIQEMSANPMLAAEKLQEAYELTFDAFDAYDNYKQAALPRMKQTIDKFAEIGADGADRLKRIEAAREYRGETAEA